MAENCDSSDNFESIKAEALIDAQLRARFELTRRVLTISSAAIGLLVTVGVSVDSKSWFVSSGLIGSLSSFVMALSGTLISLRVDIEYAKELIKDEYGQGSERVSRLNRSSREWDQFGIYLFGLGVFLLLITGISAIIKNTL